ncbi:hypothetical protein [Porcipelethomonas sp.]|uniref:hypothetical protein n=1 Tax=Porcipelethomonas sp. TaxID=2981675 RepID=UPI003076DC24
MDDLMGKIQEMLSDEESMKQISELAQMFSSSDNTETKSSESQSKPDNNGNGLPGGIAGFGMGDFDFTKILKVQEIMNKASNDKNAEFLLALKPLLREERQSKVDKAVKMLKLFTVWTVLKDSGLLNDLF